MQEINELTLSGYIKKIYPIALTPAGTSVARFVLEHFSSQIEAGTKRQVRCKVFCVYVGGNIAENMLAQQVKVNGFLSTNSQQELVLHITKIQNLDKGI